MSDPPGNGAEALLVATQRDQLGHALARKQPIYANAGATCFVDFEPDAVSDLPGEGLVGTVRQDPTAVEQRPSMQILRRNPALQYPHERNRNSFLLRQLHHFSLKILILL